MCVKMNEIMPPLPSHQKDIEIKKRKKNEKRKYIKKKNDVIECEKKR